MKSTQKTYFFILLLAILVLAGVVLQFLLSYSQKQTTASAERVDAIQQIHSDTPALISDFYRGGVDAGQQLRQQQKTLETQIREFNAQSAVLPTGGQERQLSNDNLELNHAWFALSQLMTDMLDAADQLLAQREVKTQLQLKLSEIVAQLDGLSLALGRESRLKSSVSSALDYVDLMAEAASMRSDLVGLQNAVNLLAELNTEPAAIAELLSSEAAAFRERAAVIAKDSDRVVKSKLSELMDVFAGYEVLLDKWRSTLPVLSKAYLNHNAIQQRAADFNQQLNGLQQEKSLLNNVLLWKTLSYALPLFAILLLVFGGKKHLREMSTQLALAQVPAGLTPEQEREQEQERLQLNQYLTEAEAKADELQLELEQRNQDMQAIEMQVQQHQSELDEVAAELDEALAKHEKEALNKETLQTELLQTETIAEQHRLDFATLSTQFESVQVALDEQVAQQADLQTRLAVRGTELEEEQVMRRRLQERIDGNDEKRQALLDELDSRALELQAEQQKQIELEQRLKEQELDLHGLQADLENRQHELTAGDAQRAELQANFDEQLLQLNEVHELLDTRDSDLASTQYRQKELNEELAQRESELQAVQDDLQQQSVNLEQVQAQCVELESVIVEKEAEFSQQLAQQADQAEDWQTRLARRDEDLAAEKSQHIDSLAVLEAQRSKQQEALAELLERIEEINQGGFVAQIAVSGEGGDGVKMLTTQINALLAVISEQASTVQQVTTAFEESLEVVRGAFGAYQQADKQQQEQRQTWRQQQITAKDSQLDLIGVAKEKADSLVQSLQKLSLGSKTSTEIAVETVKTSSSGVDAAKMINERLETTHNAIEGTLVPLERLTENSQLMKNVIALMDGISEQAQGLTRVSASNSSSLDVTADELVDGDARYDLFENFRLATQKMMDLIGEVQLDTESLAKAVQAGMDGVQATSEPSIVLNKVFAQISNSQSQLGRLLQALKAQADAQAGIVTTVSGRLGDVDLEPLVVDESTALIDDIIEHEQCVARLGDLNNELREAIVLRVDKDDVSLH